MSIEALLTSLKESIDRNTEAMTAFAAATGGAAPAAGKPAGKAKATKETTEAVAPAGPKHTQEEVNAALIKIKDDFDMAQAKEVIKSVAKVEKMADIPADKYDAVYDAAVAKHAELTEAANAGSNEGGL